MASALHGAPQASWKEPAYILKPRTLQSPTACPLPLLLCGQPLAPPAAEGQRVVPAHLNHWVVQTLFNARAWSCRLQGDGTGHLIWHMRKYHLPTTAILDLTCLQSTLSTGNHHGADCREEIKTSSHYALMPKYSHLSEGGWIPLSFL